MEGRFSKAADIFSLGISLLEVACDLDLPRGGDAWQQLRHQQIPNAFLQGEYCLDIVQEGVQVFHGVVHEGALLPTLLCSQQRYYHNITII